MILKEMDKKTGSLLHGWLLLSISSLIFAGVFAFLIAMSRTPLVQELLWVKDYFYKGLVGHVILAFVIWFLSFMGVIWIFSAGFAKEGIRFRMGWAGLFISTIGTFSIIISTLFGWGAPRLANYIPVLTHPAFCIGLLLFATGILLLLLNIMPPVFKSCRKSYRKSYREHGASLLAYGMAIAGSTVLIAFLCFGLAYYYLPPTPLGEVNFELLFWGGGHILQFTNTVSMIVVWIFLTNLTLKTFPLRNNLMRVLLGTYLLFALPAPLYYFIYEISNEAHKESFTRLMEFGIGPPTGILILAIVATIVAYRIRKGELPWKNPLFSSLALSVLVFTLGGIISLGIEGSNVKIPAHYHSVIGAVTLAFMGLTYHLLPLIKREIYLQKLSAVQPYLYGLGVLLFSLGLFWAGSHGVPRKTFGAAQNLDTYSKLAGMGMMGLGGIIAIAGGATFVINAVISLLRRRKEEIFTGQAKNYA